jgi:hypothetical protein
MQLFDSAKMYVFVFCAYALFALLMLYEAIWGVDVVPTASFVVQDYMDGLATLFIAVYLPVLVRKTSNSIEIAVIVLTEVMCVIAFARLLAKFGITWAIIPYERNVMTVFQCIAAALAGVRTFAVVRNNRMD